MSRVDVCETMQRQMGELFDCADFGDYYRIRTPYLYPDGDMIDLFCKFDGDLITVTDDAETMGWLQMQSEGRAARLSKIASYKTPAKRAG